jgi:arabinosyltransferase
MNKAYLYAYLNLQAVFNEMAFKPSSPGYVSPGVTVRVMDIYLFVNSKTLFRTMR